ncbi:hypothetical protein [Streptomyces sp. 891-h]|uniref:hypothetical protein n=1 Tax=unclassified Streptomyces TaxID=2593676 RepID=UPI001FAAF1CD|nr:hypothetical protein [Streptomyces sp. 891-h]UNZ20050.1 hypothetical protein HC362_26360 [Streptomyces sp. 891-h]
MSLKRRPTVRVVGSETDYRLLAVENVYDSSRHPGKQGSATVTAFLRPLAGGVEVGVPLDSVETVCDHPGDLEQRRDGRHCRYCGALIYSARREGR